MTVSSACMFLNAVECIDKIFGKGSFVRNQGIIMRKCNQKCIDINRRLKNSGGSNEKTSNNSQTAMSLYSVKNDHMYL